MQADERPAPDHGARLRSRGGMRVLFGLVVLIAAAVAGLWLGAEPWLADRVAQGIAARPDLRAGAVSPLEVRDRFGLDLADLGWRQGAVALDLPDLALWIAPLHPTELRATLPDRAEVSVGGLAHRLEMTGASAGLRLAPLHGGALRRASLQAAALRLDDAPLAEALSLDAAMAGLGHDAPEGARMAYDLDLALAGFDASALGLAQWPRALSVTGQLRLWLDGILDPGTLSGAAPPPRLVALGSDGVQLRLGEAEARLAGRIGRGAGGLAEGRVALYTRDPAALIDEAEAAGLLPEDGRKMGAALLAGIAALPLPEGGPALPDPAEGELRLPLTLAGGRIALGTIDLGPAPVFPAPFGGS